MNETSPIPARPSRKKVLISVVVLVVVLIFGWWWFSVSNMQLGSGGASSGAAKAVVVMSSAKEFSPAVITVKQGQTVTFLDNDGSGMWVASDDHPTHAKYAGTPMKEHCPDASGLKFDQCSKGVSYSFTFQKTGTWGFHNHEHPEAKGTITVTQ